MSTATAIELFPIYSLDDNVVGYTPHGATSAVLASFLEACEALGVLKSRCLLRTLARHVSMEADTDLFLRVLHGIVDAESQGFVNHELAVWALMIVGKCEDAIHREV